MPWTAWGLPEMMQQAFWYFGLDESMMFESQKMSSRIRFFFSYVNSLSQVLEVHRAPARAPALPPYPSFKRHCCFFVSRPKTKDVPCGYIRFPTNRMNRTLRHNMPLAFATAADADFVGLNRELQSLLILEADIVSSSPFFKNCLCVCSFDAFAMSFCVVACFSSWL